MTESVKSDRRTAEHETVLGNLASNNEMGLKWRPVPGFPGSEYIDVPNYGRLMRARSRKVAAPVRRAVAVLMGSSAPWVSSC